MVENGRMLLISIGTCVLQFYMQITTADRSPTWQQSIGGSQTVSGVLKPHY